MVRLAVATLVLSVLAVAVLTDDGEPRAQAQTRAAYTHPCGRTAPLRAVGRASPDDATLGPARLVAFRRLFENARAEEVYSPEPGTYLLKAALVFPGRRDLTIAVPRSHQAVLRLQYKSSGSRGHSSVRFRACRGDARGTGHPGGLVYTGPWPACVPLHVSVGGRRSQRHVLSLGAGPCPVPK